MQKKPQPATNKRTVTLRGVNQFSGPIPPPQIFKQYNDILPGAADRLLMMAEEQSIHRRKMERLIIEAEVQQVRLGQILGFIIATVGLGVAALVAIFGNALAGGVIGVGTLVSLVSVFMYGSKNQAEEKEEKKEEKHE